MDLHIPEVHESTNVVLGCLTMAIPLMEEMIAYTVMPFSIPASENSDDATAEELEKIQRKVQLRDEIILLRQQGHQVFIRIIELSKEACVNRDTVDENLQHRTDEQIQELQGTLNDLKEKTYRLSILAEEEFDKMPPILQQMRGLIDDAAIGTPGAGGKMRKSRRRKSMRKSRRRSFKK